MKKDKKKITLLTSVGVLLGSIFFVCAGTVAPVLATLLVPDESTFFLADDEYGHTYKCFLFHDNEGSPVPGVSIAWAENAANTPENLIVPQTITYNETIYTIRALSKHAFRYCDFSSIKLPSTIELIDAEAFAYCMNLESFSFPYLVDEIAPSTFMDCRKLASINYLDSTGKIVFGNEKITKIGDHAFDSCVLLREFYSPKSLVYYGEGCFKNCRSLVNYYFPSAKFDEDKNITNPITVRPFAFADCKQLVYVYFETNVTEVDDYAFIDTDLNLRIRYNGDSVPNYRRDGVDQTHWLDFYLATDKIEQIPVDINHPTILPDDTYPCLRYTLESDVVKLDSSGKYKDSKCNVTIIDEAEIAADGGEYAVIYKFDTPSVDVPGCFEVSSGTLTIPETIAGKKVKVISSSAFANNPYIKHIHFSENLVQICNRAFVNCTEIRSLDFTKCQHLKEVSYYAFYEYHFSNIIYNDYVTSLILPDCLEYIGGLAFSLFYKVNAFKLPENVKAIDDLAFFRLGFSIKENEGIVDLKLPASLNDQSAKDAYFEHIGKEYSAKPDIYTHNNYTRFYAIGKYAFNEAKCIRSVYMEDDPDHESNNSYITSFYSNTFHTATNLVRFKASKNLGYLGKDAFKACKNLREVFLTTTKSQATKADYPWCIDEDNGKYGGTLFFESLPELVCYVDGANAPGKLDTYSLTKEDSKAQINSTWNSETSNSYNNEAKNGSNLNRRVVPTYYNIDFDSIKYWKPHDNDFADNAPKTIEEYNAGLIAFAKNKVTNKYAVTRYYCSHLSETPRGFPLVDLTNIPGISDATTHDLTELGDECFGVNGNFSSTNQPTGDGKTRVPGWYFILPESITKIGDRAFYRTGEEKNDVDDSKINARFGARIVTYKNSSGNIIKEDGTAGSLADLTTLISSITESQDIDKRGYCVLPGNVTSIGRLAFYNNIFKTVRITSTLSYFGVAAFYCHTKKEVNAKGLTDTFVMGNSANFECASNGLYYIGNANKMMLLSQANGETGTLNIKAGTKAVGMQACADTQYSTINIPSGLTTIYGLGFAHNRLLTTIGGGTSLRYIGTMENYLNTNNGWSDDDYTEVWDSTIASYYENFDYRNYAYAPRSILDCLTGAFYGCNNLQTMNFKEMTELRKIGHQAFLNCKSLKYMTGTNEYVYKEYKNGNLVEITGRDSNNANVLDLTSCTKLRCIDRNAFQGCPTISFLHLPDNRNGANNSQLYIGKDKEISNTSGNIFSDNSSTSFTRVLVGETAFYAEPTWGASHSASDHYPNGIFGKNNKVYYYINKKADIPQNTGATGVRYWTYGTDGANTFYILFENATDAHAYFPA